ncbi:sigma-70 family RNA polymerase sigma factor [Thauera linaloolentis]|uniref:Anti-FecI sigma factor FecR n=1 Tax=Thauera linaloolentis (strain DSM 12138 / JCM 21573 / CCUG 41526 / CIP 105981 / IAM 15112 / NBRC 102519 / 47Lol) TaxID=1123367 RepID=N6Z4F7_THAL4|nr:sigma-70 family RNA polymerase sigma factor [Thauera linaloolentis]ENO87029.1 anti-FecI sigma factor FecR [Thauera linaloolentis 47Lol = DSM 12138]MCM8565797.1 sigma-70 family RNA polymerase sigma factor [Thauera linaloolentis]
MSSSPDHPLLPHYQAHYHALIRFLARRTGCKNTARDLAHDAWLALASKAGDPLGNDTQRNSDNYRAYIFATAANLAVNHQRRQQRTHERFVSNDEAAAQASDPALDVDRRHLHAEALDVVGRCLDALPRRTRDIFLAHRMEALSQKELAERHGISIPTVEREIRHAMDRIERALHAWRGEEAPPRKGRRQNLSRLLGVAGGALALPALWQAWRHWMPTDQYRLATAAGQFHGQALPDGSTLLLDAASGLDVAYYPTRRSATLHQGGAYFSIATDGRPFTVDALGMRLTVLGTRFAVDIEDQRVRVDVESGRVRIQAANGETRELGADQRASVQAGAGFIGATESLGAAHGAPAVAPWRDGWLDFHHIPLGLVAERLARYRPQPIHVSPAAAGLPVLGRVRIADGEAWLHRLARSLPIQIATTGDGALLITGR